MKSCGKSSNNYLSADTSYEYYKSIALDNSIECVWVYSLTSKCFKYISPSIYDLRGLTVEEAMKESLEDSLTPESLQKIKNANLKRYPRFLAGDRSDDVISDVNDFEQYCKDGSIKTIEISTRLIYSEDFKSIDVIGVSRDITKRKQYEKELIERLRKKSEISETNHKTISDELLNIRIHFFKKFAVYGINCSEPLHWSTLKNEELFAFLLIQGNKPVSKDYILDNLWPDISYEKATHYLHNTIYSMKKDLSSVGINMTTKINHNHYTYSIPEYYSDLNYFNEIIENTILPYDSVDDQSAACFEQILKIYPGDLLSYEGYLWAIPISKKINEQFTSSVLSLSRYYFLKHDYVSTKRVLLHILNIDYYNETVHELLLKVYLQDNDYISFLHHYAKLEQFLSAEYNEKPINTIQNLYNRFNKDAKFISEVKSAHF